MELILILCIPLLGTAAGAAMVFTMGNQLHIRTENILQGFAAGVMMAASVWSLLIPAMELAEEQQISPWLPAATGFLTGTVFLMVLNGAAARLYKRIGGEEAKGAGLSKTSMLVLAVTLHNLPEGMAVGVMAAGMLYYDSEVTMAGALAFSLGIAIQNIPEGAIISMPIRSKGKSRLQAFGYGVLSGVVEPIGGVITILLAEQVVQMLPYLLSFAAGAMLYVVVRELIPGSQKGVCGTAGAMGAAIGFVLMMVLDVTLG